MIHKTTTYTIDNINPSHKTISIRKDIIVFEDGVEIARSDNRRAFGPGEIEDVKEYIGVQESPEIDYLNSIWTEQVILDYRALQE